LSLQLHQSLNLLALLLLGVFTGYLALSWEQIASILVGAVVLEHLFLYFNPKRSFYVSYPSLSTAIGVIVLLYSSSLWIYLFVIALGLVQKHFLTFKGEHLFNPSNFALIMTLLFFYQEAHIVTGQFGDEILFNMVVFVLALTILVRVHRWLISFSFILFYLLFEYLLVVAYDPMVTFEIITHRFYSVTFMLFIYFMLTDPTVTPSGYKEQVLFGLLIALMISLLDRYLGQRVQHFFMALFFFSFFVHYRLFKHLRLNEMNALVTIFFVMIGVLVYIELQPPYHFEMNG